MKQHLYQQMHAQQRSLRNASAMHQNFMAPHYDGLPQAALNSGARIHECVGCSKSATIPAFPPIVMCSQHALLAVRRQAHVDCAPVLEFCSRMTDSTSGVLRILCAVQRG